MADRDTALEAELAALVARRAAADRSLADKRVEHARVQAELATLIAGLATARVQLETMSAKMAGVVPPPAMAMHPPLNPAAAEQFVTLDQIAAYLKRSKRAVARDVNVKDSGAPAPAVRGGGGRRHEWQWDTIRPWLEKRYGRKLPGRFPQ